MSRRRFFLLAGVAAILLSLAALWQWRTRENDGSAALARGVAALDAGDARTARVELMNALRADPRSIAARMAQARALVELDDGAGARAEVEHARRLGAPMADTRVPMAAALLLQQDADGALREARAGDVPESAAAAAQRIVARALAAKGDANAAAAFRRALDLAPDDARTWVAIGRYRLAQGDRAGAIGAADQAVARAPDDVRALTLRAELTRDQYGLTASLPWFEKAVAINRDSVETLTAYAATLADAGEAGRMLSVTRRILAVDPGNPRAYLMQSIMAARAGRDDLARSLLARTNGRLDGEPATMLLRGVLHLRGGNGVLAADALAALVAAQPDNRTARTLLGRAYYETGDHASAATALAPLVAQRDAGPYVLTLAARAQEQLGDRTMAADMLARAAWPVRAAADPFAQPRDAALAAGPPPRNTSTASDNVPYIRALMSQGRPDAAVERARLLARANPGAPAAQIILGDALGAAGRPAEAARAYEAAANLRFSREVAMRLVAAWSRAGDPTRATAVIRLYLDQNPADVEGQRLAAAAAMQAGDWSGALRLLRAVRAQLGDNDAVLMADMARAALELGDKAAARAYAAHAYRLMPGNPMTADVYGWTLLRTGWAGPAPVDLLEKAVVLAPDHPMLQMHLGQAYAASGRKAEAHAALSRAAAAKDFVGRQQALDAIAAL